MLIVRTESSYKVVGPVRENLIARGQKLFLSRTADRHIALSPMTRKLYLGLGGKTLAANCFRKVLLLEPSNGEAANKLKKAEEMK